MVSHFVRETSVNAKFGQNSTCLRVMFLVVVPFGIEICSLPMPVATNRVWSVALIGQGVMVWKVNHFRVGDMCTDVPESYTLTSDVDSGLLSHASVAPANVVVKVNPSPPIVAFAESFTLPASPSLPSFLIFLEQQFFRM